MRFSIVRLGKSSIPEITRINSLVGVQEPNLTITVKCKQVPIEVDNSTYCFLWLGSDNNKGLPTTWAQGLKAIGKITHKSGGPSYNDDWNLTIGIGIVFVSAIKQFDILNHAASDYLKISEIPVIGLNTHSNQTVQLIKDGQTGQSVGSLLNSLIAVQNNIYQHIVAAYPELLPLIDQELTNQNSVDNELFNSESINNSEGNKTKEEFEETEDTGSSVIIHPFDPTKIDIRPQPLTILSIIKRLESVPMRIDLDTEFQRKGDLWEIAKQSKLIESLLVRIPLPAFYFDGTSDKWLIVDGLQRISALKNFVLLKSFKLKGLEYLKDFEGSGWDDLPPYLQTRIEETPITAYIINPGTPEEVKFNIFKRINTGGLVLTPQEIRHALNQGIPANFIKELAKEPVFLKAMGGKVPTDRMEDRDYVTRFVGYYLDGKNYQPDLDTFLNKGMGKLKSISPTEREKIVLDFRKAMEAAYEIFGNHAFRKRRKINERRKPINKALFECISVTLAKLQDHEIVYLINKKETINISLINLINTDDNFFRAISSGTGDTLAVERRYSKIENLFNSVIND